MKIDSVETFLVPPRWLFVKISTDEGIHGWGEAALEGRAATVAAAIDELSDYLVGEEALKIEDHWQVLTKGGFYRGGPILSSAVAGIDQALWDIMGKHHGAPVHELLGGPVRDRARVYPWIGGDRPDDVAVEAQVQIEQGFSAVKMNAAADLEPIDTPAQTRAIIERAEAVRDVLGLERDLAIDFHGRLSTAMARRVLPQLEAVHPLFVEEPILPENWTRLREVTSCTTIPIATGERLYSRWDFRDVLPTGIAVVQPDVCHAGGISEMRRIAAMAEAHDVALAPHCPLGPIALAASLQVAFASPNFLIQEEGLGIHYNREGDVLDYLADSTIFEFSEGYLKRPMHPGLGVDIDEPAVRKAAARGHRWRPPVWRRSDGSFAEW